MTRLVSRTLVSRSGTNSATPLKPLSRTPLVLLLLPWDSFQSSGIGASRARTLPGVISNPLLDSRETPDTGQRLKNTGLGAGRADALGVGARALRGTECHLPLRLRSATRIIIFRSSRPVKAGEGGGGRLVRTKGSRNEKKERERGEGGGRERERERKLGEE